MEQSNLIALSLNEIRRLFNRITAPIIHSTSHILHWSTWRRHSQMRARTSHYKRRANHDLSLSY